MPSTPLLPQSRDLTVSYGGFALSDANGIFIQGKDERYKVRESYVEGFFSCELLVRLLTPTGVAATDNASMRTLVAAIAANLRKPRQRLLVQLSGGTILDWNFTLGSRTAFDIQPSFEKVGDQDDNARVQKYRFTVTARLPADLSGQNYRAESTVQTVSTMLGRRTCIVTGAWTTSGTTTALDQYTAQADTYFASVLPTPVAGGEWVLLDSNPQYEDENAVLAVRRTYIEVVSGLLEYQVEVTTLPNQARQVSVSGTYTKTAGSTAKANHDSGVGPLVTNILTAIGISASLLEAKPIKREGYDTTGERYFFARTYTEIVYAQGSSTDDAAVTEFTLNVALATPSTQTAMTNNIRPQRLRRGAATYSAILDKTVTTDPYGTWTSSLRAHVVAALQQKLNTGTVIIENEAVAVDLDQNRISAQLGIVIRGGNVLSLAISEEISETNSMRAQPMADGDAFSFFLFRQPPTRRLERAGLCEYDTSGPAPVLFEAGESSVSGLALVNTKQTAEDNLEEQKRGSFVQGWMCEGLKRKNVPTSRGDDDGLETSLMSQAESWFWIEKGIQGGASS